jgi:hypothetical protein
MQLQLHRNPGLLDYEAGTFTSSPVASGISHLQTFFFFSLENARIPSTRLVGIMGIRVG